MKEKELIPADIKSTTLAIARCEFHQKSIYSRAFSALLVGFALSLIVCPQFGFGLPSGHGISHLFWVIGPWACALFCGLFLFLCGILSLSLVLNRFERFWFMQKTAGTFALLPAILWMAFMILPETDYVSIGYTASWVVGFVGMWLISKGISKAQVRVSP